MSENRIPDDRRQLRYQGTEGQPLVSVASGLEHTETNRRSERSALLPEAVDAGIARHVEKLKARAVVPPVEEEPDEEAVRLEEEQRRAAQRADTVRRMKSSCLVQRQLDGSIKFVHDLGVRDDGRLSR